MRTPLELSGSYGASRHATLHYYVEEHPDVVALLIAGRYPHVDGSIPIWQSVESAEFRRRFGRLKDRLPDGKLMLTEGDRAPLAEILRASRVVSDPPARWCRFPTPADPSTRSSPRRSSTSDATSSSWPIRRPPAWAGAFDSPRSRSGHIERLVRNWYEDQGVRRTLSTKAPRLRDCSGGVGVGGWAANWVM
jgi:hypothetical protein